MRISEFWIHVADRLWELVAFGGLTACLTLSECPPKHSAHLHGHEMGYGLFRYKVVSIQVYSGEEEKVPLTWLKERRAFTQNVFLVHAKTLPEVKEIFVQFHCLSSYQNDLFRNDFEPKRPFP